MRNLTLGLLLAIGVLGGFYGGWHYSQSRIDATAAGAVAGTGTGTTGSFAGTGAGGAAGAAGTGAAGGAGTAGGGFAGRGVTGQVVSLSGDTLTIRDAQGNTVKVTLQGGTPVLRTSTGSVTDLVAGATVTVAGQRNSDGSVNATAVTVVPAGLRPQAGPSPGG